MEKNSSLYFFLFLALSCLICITRPGIKESFYQGTRVVRNFADSIELVKNFQNGTEIISHSFVNGWEIIGNRVTKEGDTIMTVKPLRQKRKEKIHDTVNWDPEKIQEEFNERGALTRAIQNQIDYVVKHKSLAVAEMRAYGIPASITLAQGILESNSGESELAIQALNHFGIKCRKDGPDCDDWIPRGRSIGCLQKEDDSVCDHFCVYESIADSYQAHKTVLLNPRYREIFDFPVSSGLYKLESKWYGAKKVPYYAGVAAILKKGGYATSETYHKKVSKIINDLQLWRIDFI